MSIPNFPQSEYTSANLEKVAIERLRTLLPFLSVKCKIYREIWGQTTALCLDLQDCPNFLEIMRKKSPLITKTSRDLGLANSLVFRFGNKILGWETVK
jgi:hypothetical protein